MRRRQLGVDWSLCQTASLTTTVHTVAMVGGRPTRGKGTAGHRVIDATYMKATIELMTKGPEADPAAAALVASANRKALAAYLRSFGEDSVASAVEAASDRTVWFIGQRGIQISFSGENIPRSLCLAAVEVIEGRSRSLARKRRKRVPEI